MGLVFKTEFNNNCATTNKFGAITRMYVTPSQERDEYFGVVRGVEKHEIGNVGSEIVTVGGNGGA